MKNKSLPTYLPWADVVRILAIVMVVLVHTFTLNNGQHWSAVTAVFLFVLAKTCVPLFVMLSGALLLPKVESTAVFFQKRMGRILLPWLTWTAIVLVVTKLSELHSIWQVGSAFRVIFTGYFTFLPLLFCLYLLIPILRIVVQQRQTDLAWYLIGCWFLATSLLPYLRDSLAFPLAVDNGLVTQTVRFSGFLVLGWLLARQTLTRKTILILLAIMAASSGVTVWLMKQTALLNYGFAAYHAPLMIIVGGCFFVILVNLVPPTNRLSSRVVGGLRTLSQASFGVFLAHTLVAEVFFKAWPILNTGSLFDNLGRWSLVTALSFGLIVILNRHKTVGRFIT